MIRTFAFVILLFAFGTSLQAGPLTPQRVSMNPSTLASGDASSDTPSLSSDGRYVAFVSQADNLVSGYSGLSTQQIYVYDRQNNVIELISVSTSGTAGADQECTSPQISADGRYVSFVSGADNIDMEGSGVRASEGLHIRDRQTGTTFPPITLWNTGGPTYVGDGNYARLLMSADATRFGVTMGSSVLNTELIDISGRLDTVCPTDSEVAHGSTPPQPCDNAVISADGGTIAFRTAYPSLVGDDTNGFVDVFVYNATSRTIARASINADASQGNGDVDVASGFEFAGNLALSSDGNLLAFNSGNATNLGGSGLPKQLLLIKNLATGDIQIASTTTDDSGTPAASQMFTYGPQFDGDGGLLVFQSQSSGVPPDVRVRAMDTQHVRSLCLGPSGNSAASGCRNVAISADGHWAAFASSSTDLAPYPVAPSFVEQDVYLVNIDAIFDVIFADGFEH